MTEDTVTFRVETLTDGTADLTFDAEVARELRERLDEADSYVACLDCGDLATIGGPGVPETMPRCQVCGEPMHGVVEVTVVGMADEEGAGDA